MNLQEQETTINFDRSSPTAEIYTADPAMIRRYDKLASQTPVFTCVKADKYGKWYECPKTMIKVKKPNELSSEKRAMLAERMKVARATKAVE